MFTADLLERVVKTYLQTFLTLFLGALAVPANIADVGAWKAAGLAALAASVSGAFSAAMSVISKRVGNRNSASIVPTATPPASAVSK